MIIKKINIDSIEKIQSFVRIINTCSGRFDLVSGCCHVDAKSLMGILTLDISRPLDLYIYNEENVELVLHEIASYIVPNQKGGVTETECI